MTLEEIKEYVNTLITHVLFEYNGKNCGIDPFSHNEFDMWYGDEYVTLDSIDDVMNYKLFDGKSLSDIWDDVTDLDY